MGGRWRDLWRAVDQFGQLIDFRLTARRDARAEGHFCARRERPCGAIRPLRSSPTRRGAMQR
nr:transposase [Alloyangia pacifica]